MARQRPRQRSLGTLGFALVVGLVLIVGAGVTFGALVAGGVITFGPNEPSHEGQIAVPSTMRPIEAYAKITRDDFYNPETGRLNVIWLYKDVVSDEMIRDLGALIGRVANHDIPSGRVLTEANLLPRGTRPGIAAGIPSGKRAMVVDAAEVRGLDVLAREDRFDLLVTLPVEDSGDDAPQAEYGLLAGGVEAPGTGRSRLRRQSGVRVLVQGGVLISTVEEARQRHRDARQGAPNRGRGEESGTSPTEVTVAIAPEEITPLTEALALGFDIFCVARSGRPDDPNADTTTGPDISNMVAVPATSRGVFAYQRIRQDDLADPATGTLKTFYFTPEQVREDWLLDVDDVLGRVVARDLGPGRVLTEADLLPIGSPEGVAGAIPAGRRAVVVATDAIVGLDNLRRGDHFDLLSARSIDLTGLAPTVHVGGRVGSVDLATAALGNRETSLAVLASDAILIDVSEGEAVVAVYPAEVTAIADVLSTSATLHCVARPGSDRPESRDVPRLEEIPERRPRVELHRIEHLRPGGLKREELWIRPVATTDEKAADSHERTDSPIAGSATSTR